MPRIGVIGSGVWGTALALTAARAQNDILCWDRTKEVITNINQLHINKKYLPDIILPQQIRATENLGDIFEFSNIILLAVSAQGTRDILKQIKSYITSDTIIVFCAKGIEENSGKMLSEIALEEIPKTDIAILSGPGFASDVAQRKIVSVTIASKIEKNAAFLTKVLGTPYFRPYLTTDIISPQIGGSVKNVIAIASGIVEGASFGDGARAALITRGFHEMACLSRALGGELHTMMGMCGIGDLAMTASCKQSRNFSFGYEIGVSGSAQIPLSKNKITVEGIHTAKAVVKRAKEIGVEMPICEMVNHILFNNIALKDAVEMLLSRSYKSEGI